MAGGGMSVRGNAGGADQLLGSRKSTVPPENRAAVKSTVPPENSAAGREATVPPENSASWKPTATPGRLT